MTHRDSKRRVVLALVAALTVLAMMPAAQADTDQATLTVSVNTTTTILFSDDTAAFGSVNSGTTTIDENTLTYSLQTNNTTGATVALQTANAKAAGGPTFALAQDNGSPTFVNLPDATATTFGGTWRQLTSPGSANYVDDARVTVSAIVPTGNYTRLVDYIATSS